MADIKLEVQDLPTTSTQNRNDVVPVQKIGGSTNRLSIAAILGLLNGSDIAAAASLGAGDDTFDDGDKFVYLTGLTLKLGALSGVVSSIFKTTRTIANARFAGSTFGLVFGAFRAIFSGSLTADRTLTIPDANVDLSRLNNMLGFDQSLQSPTRSGNTVYQNTTGRPINVFIRGGSGTSGSVDLSPDNSTWFSVGAIAGTPNAAAYLTVQPGEYYRANSTSIAAWTERR